MTILYNITDYMYTQQNRTVLFSGMCLRRMPFQSGSEPERERVGRQCDARRVRLDGFRSRRGHVVPAQQRGDQRETEALHQPLADARPLAGAERDEVLRLDHLVVGRDEPLRPELGRVVPIRFAHVQLVVVKKHGRTLFHRIACGQNKRLWLVIKTVHTLAQRFPNVLGTRLYISNIICFLLSSNLIQNVNT